MSMIFDRLGSPTSSCPRCQCDCTGAPDEEIECPKCHLIFRRIIDEDGQDGWPVGSLHKIPLPKLAGPDPPQGSRKRKRSTVSDQELALYRRVRIRNYFTANLGEPVQFDHAINYVKKIKARYLDNGEVYKQFLEILQAYQRESRPMFEVYMQITSLFQDQPDLVEDFKSFLPESAARADAQHSIVSKNDKQDINIRDMTNDN
jgi:hypothetical protein